MENHYTDILKKYEELAIHYRMKDFFVRISAYDMNIEQARNFFEEHGFTVLSTHTIKDDVSYRIRRKNDE